MQESRLFKIVYYLLNKEQTTASELAETFEVSVRTIYRDIDVLSGSGIPIYTELGRNGGIRLMNNFVLNRALFSEEDQQNILTALQSLNATKHMNSDDILNKLSALFQVNLVKWLEVDFSRWGDKPNDNRKFEMIKTAVIHSRYMKISYVSSKGKISERVIEPLKLLYKSKDWYLKAYCRLRQDFRMFKLNRILTWELLEEKFLPMPYPDIQIEHQQMKNRIILRFHKEIAYRVCDEFDINQIQIEENGDIVVTTDMPEDEWLIGYLLSFGTQVEIIEPDHLKKNYEEKVRELYENLRRC